MTKYNWQEKKRKLATESIYRTKLWSTIQNNKNKKKTPRNSKENDMKAKKR